MFAVVAAGCGLVDEPATAPLITTPPAGPAETSATPVVAAEIEQVVCPSSLDREGVSCGIATVALDSHTDPDAKTTISITAVPGYDDGFVTPVAVLQGGPGGASTDMAAWFPQQAFTQVFIDQRGTGFAESDFNCDEFDLVLPTILESGADEAATLTGEAFDACAGRFVDNALLDATTTQNHAADVGAVMAGLGYARWVAYGVSYGTTIGLELLRQPPTGLVGVVLDGVYPPDLDVETGVMFSGQASVDAVAAACASSEICRSYIDDFSATLDSLVSRLDAEPLTVDLGANETGFGEAISVRLDGVRLAEFVFLMLYSEAQIRYLPSLLGALDDGDPSAAKTLVALGSRITAASYSANDEATYFAVTCHDRLPFADDSVPDELGAFVAALQAGPLEESCAAWDQDEAYEIAGTAVSSDVAALLLSGSLDPITPPSYAAAAAATLSASTQVVQAGRSHGIWFGNECIASIVQDFVADPARTLNTECADTPVAINWARP